jgi:hypothetical protein
LGGGWEAVWSGGSGMVKKKKARKEHEWRYLKIQGEI